VGRLVSDVSPDDRGFALGHGLFETLLWVDHHLGHWDAHLARLERGSKVLGLPKPDQVECRNAVEKALIAAGSPSRAAVRLNWSAGVGGRGLDAPIQPQPVLTATAAVVAPPRGPASLATVEVRRNEHSPASRLKTLSYLDNVLARAEARAAAADEALMLNTAGEVACAAAANVFWIRHGVVCTPALACGVLDGIMRADTLRACTRLGLPFEEVQASPALLRGMPMFLTNSLVGVRAVSRLDGRELPPSPEIVTLARTVNPASR
jgi:branched-subunit amino acid aminotransferase/4-amino-4-deoxychorismate lyase